MVMITASVMIDRAVEDVFAYYSDPANRVHWSVHTITAGWVKGDQPAVDSVFQFTTTQFGRTV